MNSSDRPSLHATLKRTASEFMENNLTDWAAALTYYGLLALFPALIAMVSLIGLVGDPQSTTSSLTEIVTEIGPASAAETFSGPIESVASNQGAAGAAFVLGLALALWSASGYVGAFIRASNIIFETSEGRAFWKLRPLQMAVTLAMVLMMALLALGLVLTGPIVAAIADPLGFSDTAISDLEHGQVAGDGGDLHPHGRRPLLRLSEREAARLRLGHAGQPGGDRGLGRSPPPASPSTSPTSAPMTRPTAPSAASSPCSSGSGSATWRSSSATSSTPSASAASRSRRDSCSRGRRSS